MNSVNALIKQAAVYDFVLGSIQASNPEIYKQWIEVAREQVAHYRAGKATFITEEEALQRIDDIVGQ